MILSPTGKEKTLDTLLQIRISKKLKTALEKLADRDQRSLSDFVRIKLEELAGGRK